MRIPGIIDILAWALILGLLLQPSAFSGDPGIGWHLKSGEWILLHLSVPRTDLFLTGLAGTQPWIHTQWLSDAIFALLHVFGGWPLLNAVGIAILIFTWICVLAPLTEKSSGSIIAATLTLLLSAMMGATQWFLRPVLFSFLFFAITLSQTHKLSDGNRYRSGELLFWAVFFSLWSQLHPAFVLGLALLFCAMLCADSRASARLWAKRLVVAALGTLLNPYGADLHRNILKLSQSKFFMNLNSEWLSPDFHIRLFWPFLLSLALLWLLGLRRRAGLSRFDVLTVALFATASLVYRRYIPFFGIVAAVPLAKLFASNLAGFSIFRRLDRRMREGSRGLYPALTVAALIVFTLFAGHLPLKTAEDSAPNSRFPEAAIQQIAQDSLEGPIFHTPDWGGFITLTLWPMRQAFIDDRNELIGEERYRDFLAINRGDEGWEALLAKYQFEWLLLQPKSLLLNFLRDSNTWELFYRDDQAVLFRKVQGLPDEKAPAADR